MKCIIPFLIDNANKNNFSYFGELCLIWTKSFKNLIQCKYHSLYVWILRLIFYWGFVFMAFFCFVGFSFISLVQSDPLSMRKALKRWVDKAYKWTILVHNSSTETYNYSKIFYHKGYKSTIRINNVTNVYPHPKNSFLKIIMAQEVYLSTHSCIMTAAIPYLFVRDIVKIKFRCMVQ